MAQQKKRTAGDDLRDFKAGKISGNYYHNGIDRSDNYVQHTSAPYRMTNDKGKTQIVSYNDWLQQEVFKGKHALPNGTTNNSTSSLQNNFDRADSSAKNFKKAIEDPNKSLNDKLKAYTSLYNAAVAVGDNETAKKTEKEYNNLADKVSKQLEINNNKAKEYEKANSLKGMTQERKKLVDERNRYALDNGLVTSTGIDTSKNDKYKVYKEYSSKIDELDKQIAEKQRNGEYDLSDKQKAVLADIGNKANILTESFEDKYKNSTLEQRQNARIHATTSELNWLNKHMYDNATSEELENEYSKYKNEYESKRKAIQKDGSKDKGLQYTNLKNEYDEKIGNIEAEILKSKQREAGKVLNDNIKAKTVLQKYYSLDLYNKLRDEYGHTYLDSNITDEMISNKLNSKTQRDSFDYISGLSEDERKKIEKDFNNLSVAGYDTNTLYKWYERESNAKIADEVNGNLKEFADEHPVVASAASVGLRLAGAGADAVKYISTNIDKNINGGDGYINPNETYTAMSDNIRSKVSENINDDFGSFLYNTGMSMADFASLIPLNAVPGGQALSLGIMGTSAGVGAANEVIENGGTIDNAVKTGFAAGIAETLFEKVSLEQLSVFKASGKSTMRAAIGDILKGAFTEGSEEAFTDLANRLTDDAINGDLSSYNRSKQRYIEQGMSEADAEKAASWEFWQNVALDFTGGAMSGGALNLITAGVNLGGVKLDLAKNKESNLADGKTALADENFDINLLIKQGLAAEKNDRAYNLAKKMEKAIENGGKEKIEAADVGNLRFLIGREISRNPELINRIAEVTKAETENAQSGQTVNRNTVQNTQEVPQNEQESIQPSQANSVINTTKKADTESVSRQYEVYAFGKKHPNGIMATDISTGKSVKIALKNLESSSKVNLNDEENTLVFNTTDGKQVNADSIIFSNSKLDTIVHSANEFDTYGARNYISNFEEWSESPQAQKMSDEEQLYKYNNAYSAAYNYGREGVKFDTLKQGESSNYRILNSILGENIIKQAMSAGRRDVNIINQHHANRLTELINRNGRADTSGATVYADNGTDVSHIPQELINTLGNLATKTGRNIIISDRLADGVNGVAKDGNIYLSSEITSQKILATALHEAGHTIKKTNPTEWQTLSDFVSDYLVRRGIDIDKMIDRTIERYGNRLTPDEGENTRDAALEEIVCDTLMSLASDEKALNIALSTRQNKSKIAAAIKSLINKVKEWLTGKSTNYGAKAFAKDIDALEQLAERFSEAADTARENITEQTEVQNGEKLDVEKYSIKRNRHYAKHGGTFSNALTSDEWTKFSNAMSTGLDAGLRISDNSILVECEENSKYQYKLVIYDNTFEDNPLEKVYAIGNIDYNKINVKDIADFIIKLEDKKYDSRKILQKLYKGHIEEFGYILGQYNIKSKQFNEVGRKSVENGRIDEGQSNRAGVNQEIGRELSSGVKEKFSLDEDYDFSDPSKLDEEELKIYNNRGWSYGLFNKEDMALLSEKVLELKKGTQKADNALWDGSRLVEVNNKLIILGGTFKNPEIYSILVINANNETDAEFIKGDFYYDFNRCKRFREVVTNLCKSIEIVQGEEFVRFYDSIDYTYKRGRGRNWVPATLPSNFEDYGYSKGRNERYGSSFRTGKSVSAVQLNEETDNSTDEKTGVIHDTLKFSIDDEYDDLFDFDYADDKHIDFEKAVDENNPELTIEQIYHHSARNVKEGLLAGKGIKPETKKIYNMVKSVMRNYHINTNAKTESLVTDYVDALNTFINSVQNDKSSFTDAFENFVMQCRESLTYSTQLDEQHEAWAEKIRKELYGTTLLIPDSAIDTIKENYGSVGKYRKSLFGKINVKLEKNARGITGSANGSYIEDIGSHLEEIGGRSLMIEDGFDWDSDSGYRMLDRIINYVLAPQYVSTYGGQIQSESTIDAAAIQMAFDTTAEYLKEQGRAAVQQNNIDKKKLRDLNKNLKQAQKAKNALHKKTVENYKEDFAKQQEKIKQLRADKKELNEQNARLTAIVNMERKTVAEEYRAERDKTKYRQKISTTLERLINRHLKPKPNKNVPISVVQPLYNLLSELTGNYEGFSKGVNDLTEKTGYNNTVDENGERKNTVTLSRETEQLIKAINHEISATDGKITLPPALRNALMGYDATDDKGHSKTHFKGLLEDVKGIFENAEKRGKTSLKDFSIDELERISEALSQVKNMLDKANKVVINGKEYDAYLISRKGAEELQKIQGTKKRGSVNEVSGIKRVLELYRNHMADPIRFARMITGYNNDSVLVQMMEMLNQGQSDAQTLSLEWKKKIENELARFDYESKKKYVREKAMEFESIDPNTKKPLIDPETGEPVKAGLTADMLVEMLLEYEDEYGRAHMMYSGYQVPNIKYIKRKNQQLMYSKDSGCYILPTEATIAQIKDFVMHNDICRTVYELCHDMYNNDMQVAVNQVSTEKYGYEIAKVKNYCPITIDDDTVYGTYADVLINRSINSRAFLHEREKFKYNRLKLKGAIGKLQSQIDSVSSWCGLTMPIENFNRVYNMTRFEHEDDNLIRSVQNENLIAAESVRQKNNTPEGVNKGNGRKSIKDIINRSISSISKTLKFNVKEEFKFETNPKTAIEDYFKEIGGSVYREDLGIIELGKSGAKSTIEHGYGKDKLNAVPAIAEVIKSGDIIDYRENYKGDGVDRYTICAKGLLPNETNCYVAVVVKSSPKSNNENARFYLHEVQIINEASLPPRVDPHQKGAETTDKLASNEIVPLDNENVKYSVNETSRNSQKKSKTEYFPSMKEIMKQQWGDESGKYISKLMGDLQGSTKQVDPGRIDMLTGKYIRAVLTANISSAIKQLSSYPLAAARVGWRATLAGLKHIRPGKHTPFLNRVLPDSYKHNVPYDEIAKYTPILEYRKQGNNSREMAEISKYKGLIDSSGLFGHALDRLNWIEEMDVRMVDMNYWIAYEFVKGDLKISPDSKEFMPTVAKTLEDIINNMMPNSSIMQQGQIHRSKNPINRVWTICKSQVFCMVNAAMDASGEYNARLKDYKTAEEGFKKKQARTEFKAAQKKLERTYSAILVSTVMTCGMLMPLIAAAFGKWDRYRDEDGNITPWSIGSRMLKDLGSEMSGMFLYGDTVYNAVLSIIDRNEDYYGISLPGIDTVNDLVNGIINIARSDSPEKLMKNISSLVGTLGMMTGLPTKNLMNLWQGASNHFKNFTKYGGTPTVNDYGEITMQMYANYCYEALMDGDEKKYAKLYSEWLKEKTSSGKQVDKSYIKSKLKTELEDDKGIIAAGNAFFNGDLTTYENTVEKYAGLGFDKTTVVHAINSVVNDLEEEQEKSEGLDKYASEKDSDKEPELYSYSDAFDFLKNGDTESYQKVEKYLMENKDKSKNQIKTLMQGASRTDPIFKQYIEASKSNDADTTHTLYKQLLNIYGSESKFKSALKKYQDKVKKQESK